MQDNNGNGYYYIGSLIYSNSNLESTDFSQGRITLGGGTQTIHYHHRDHLGSVRAITNGSGTVIEQNDYYPFGGRLTFGQNYTQTSTNRYKFNGKEEQTIGGLDLLDYGARMYDPAIGRWTAQDPLGEEMYNLSPYRFSLNDPINYVDPNGLFESRKDARKYRREHDDVSGRISKNKDGSFSIINNNEGVIYTRTNQTESLVVDEEGVERAALVTPYTNNENLIIQAIYDAQSGFINNPIVVGVAGLLATMMLPQVSMAYKSFIPAKPVVTKSSLKYGQYMHRLYHIGEEGKEYSKIKGIRPDFVDVKNRIIYELKPNNPRSIKQGYRQLEMYKNVLSKNMEENGV